MKADYSFYFVTDSSLETNFDFLEFIDLLIQAGVTLIQLREKELNSHDFFLKAKKLKEFLVTRKIPLIINDRVDIALAVGAEGVHLGQEDLPYAVARKLLGPQAILGLTIENSQQLIASQDLDYLGIGPIFPTQTKKNTKGEWGLAELKKVREESSYPLVAIGGINASNAGSILATKVDGIAVVSALTLASDPKKEAQKIKKIITEFKK